MTYDSLDLQCRADELARTMEGEGRRADAQLIRALRSWGRANEERLERIGTLVRG